jgi:hypothetical protein
LKSFVAEAALELHHYRNLSISPRMELQPTHDHQALGKRIFYEQVTAVKVWFSS